MLNEGGCKDAKGKGDVKEKEDAKGRGDVKGKGWTNSGGQ